MHQFIKAYAVETALSPYTPHTCPPPPLLFPPSVVEATGPTLISDIQNGSGDKLSSNLRDCPRRKVLFPPAGQFWNIGIFLKMTPTILKQHQEHSESNNAKPLQEMQFTDTMSMKLSGQCTCRIGTQTFDRSEKLWCTCEIPLYWSNGTPWFTVALKEIGDYFEIQNSCGSINCQWYPNKRCNNLNSSYTSHKLNLLNHVSRKLCRHNTILCPIMVPVLTNYWNLLPWMLCNYFILL